MDSTRTHPVAPAPALQGDLGQELRQSLLLLGISVAVTTVVTVAAQATVSLLILLIGRESCRERVSVVV